MNPDKPYYQQLSDLIESLKPFEVEEEEYKAKRQELHDSITYKAFMDPNYSENIIRIIKKYRPDYQISKNSQDTSKKVLTALVNKITDSLDNDFNDRKNAELARFKQSCTQILTPSCSDKDSNSHFSLIDNVSSTLFKTKNINSCEDIIKTYTNRIYEVKRIISDYDEVIKEQKEELITYRKYLIENPQIAPFYKPYQDSEKIYQELIDLGGCLDVSDVVDSDLQHIISFLEKLGLIKPLYLSDRNRIPRIIVDPAQKSSSINRELFKQRGKSFTLIDITDETSKQTAQYLCQKKAD